MMSKRFSKGSKISYLYKPVRKDVRSKVLLFFAHATGMHKELFLPNVERIRKRFDFDFAALDFRGHGDSPKLKLDEDGFMRKSWDRIFVEDIYEVLRELPKYEMILGIGHSMGAANLVHAQLSRRCFDGLVLCEPILPFPGGTGLMRDSSSRRHPFAERTVRRRNSWKNVDEAMKYFLSKPMFARWHKDCVKVHVQEGLKRTDDNEFKLKCEPVQEASIYDGTGTCIHERLHEIKCPTIVMVGEKSFHMSGPDMKTVAAFQAIASMFSDTIPDTNKMTTTDKAWVVPNCTHFFPQENPNSIVNAVISLKSAVSRVNLSKL